MAETIHSSNVSPGETNMRNQEFISILDNKIPEAINSFKEIVKKPKFTYYIQESLKHPAQKDQNTVNSELNLLDDLLGRYLSHPDNFSVRNVAINKKNGVLRVNLGDDSHKKPNENGENQLSFSFKDPSVSDEHEEAIFSASLSRKSPQNVLTRFENYERLSIQINSIYVNQDDNGKNKVDPHAGVVYNLSKENVISFGVHYDSAKTAPIYIPILKTINLDQFETFKNFIQSFK